VAGGSIRGGADCRAFAQGSALKIKSIL